MRHISVPMMMAMVLLAFVVGGERDVFGEIVRKADTKKPYERQWGFYENGEKIALETTDERGRHIVEGTIPDGLANEYDESGRLYAIWNYKDNMRHGDYKVLNEFGDIYQLGYFQEGERHGLYKELYENGVTKVEGEWERGVRDGIWNVYYSNANLKARVVYDQGNLEGGYTIFSRNGEILDRGTWDKTNRLMASRMVHMLDDDPTYDGHHGRSFSFSDRMKYQSYKYRKYLPHDHHSPQHLY